MLQLLAVAGLSLFAVWAFYVDLDRLVRAQYYLVPREFYLRHPFFLVWAYGSPWVSIRSWGLLLAAFGLHILVVFTGYALVMIAMEPSVLRDAGVLAGGVLALTAVKGFAPFLVPNPRESAWESQWPLTEKELARYRGRWRKLELIGYCKLLLKAIKSEHPVRRVTLRQAAQQHLASITGSDSKLYCYFNSDRMVVPWERFEAVDQTEPDQIVVYILRRHHYDLKATLAAVRTFHLGSEEKRAHELRMRANRTLYVGPERTGQFAHKEIDESPYGMGFQLNSSGWRPRKGDRVRVALGDKMRAGEVAHVTRTKQGPVFGVKFDVPDDGGLLRYGTRRFWDPRGPSALALS